MIPKHINECGGGKDIISLFYTELILKKLDKEETKTEKGVESSKTSDLQVIGIKSFFKSSQFFCVCVWEVLVDLQLHTWEHLAI